MTGGTESWLAELARAGGGPVPWARMTHAALAVCAPLGLGIALLIGYAPWPAAWHAHLPGKFANAVDKVSRYTEEALLRRSAGRPGLRRQTYRALSDLRTEFQRTMAEPPAVAGGPPRGGPPSSPWRA